MPDSGRRFLAPTQQGTGDALTAANAAAASDRLTVEAALRAAGVADPTVKASGTPADVALEICWRADLGSYSGLSFSPDGTHGGISATRKLRHISVNGSGNAIAHSVTRNHSTLTTTATGEANVAMFVGTRTDDPRSVGEKAARWMVNVSSITRFVTTVDFAFVDVSVPVGQALKPDGTVHNYGTGAWAVGNTFETPSGSYNYVIWDGFKWKRWQYVFLISNATLNITHWEANDNFVENIKTFIRNTTAPGTGNSLDLVVDGLYARSWAQSLVRQDFGTCIISNVDGDAEWQVGDNITGLAQFATGDSGTIGPATVQDFIVKNCWHGADSAGDYRQGDGVIGNRASHDISIKRGVIDTAGDSAFDVKAYATDPNGYALYVEDLDMYAAKRNMRCWGGDDLDEGGGLFNRYYLKNVRSFDPKDKVGGSPAHLQVSGTKPGTVEWENPGGGVAMTDAVGTTPDAIKIDMSVVSDHILITLRDLTFSQSGGSPAINAGDNTSTYPTEAAAEAAGTKQVRIQQVSGAGWTGTISVNGVVYDNSTLSVTEGDTSRIDVSGAFESMAVTAVPAEIGDVTVIDADTADVRWRNTDGSEP
jgi:hypothetical protein